MLVIGIAILICGTGVAGAAILEEGFETSVPPTGWIEQQLVGTADWTQESSGGSPSCSPHEGSYMAKFNSYSCSSGDSASLNTSEMDFSGLTDVELKFRMYHDTGYSTNNDRITIRCSTDNSTWTDLTTISRYKAGSNDWEEHTVSLSAYDDETSVWISFAGISDYGNNMYIDEVEISPPPLPCN